MRRLIDGATLLLAGLAWLAPALARAEGPPPPRPLQATVESLLQQQGVAPEHAALLLYSTAQRRYLAAVRQDQPMVAASNTKLVTTYAALRVLGPNYRWRTRFSVVVQNDGAGGAPRQGLLVEGSGDPTLTPGDLQAMALRLKAEGVRRIDGPIYLDGSLFQDDMHQEGLPPESPGYVPLSPFIVDSNAVEFTISRSRPGPPDVLSVLPPDGVRVVSQLQDAATGRSIFRLDQDWNADGGKFTLSGTVTADPKVHTVTTSVSDPAAWFYAWFRVAMQRMGIEGQPPLRRGAPAGVTPRLVFTWLSPPLREAIVEIDKQSSNLGAEILLRTLGQTVSPTAVTGADGLKVVRRMLAREFPGMEAHYRLADGSGLSRNNQLSPLFLVRLLNRVLQEPAFRTEFLAALPVVGWDGTLRYRGASADLEGRIRAKTGTLTGVSDLSGYLTTADDTIVFSFLINDPTRQVEENQAAQDQVMAGIYDALTAPKAADIAQAALPAAKADAKTAPAAKAAHPPAAKQADPVPAAKSAADAITPPPASPKPKRAAP